MGRFREIKDAAKRIRQRLRDRAWFMGAGFTTGAEYAIELFGNVDDAPSDCPSCFEGYPVRFIGGKNATFNLDGVPCQFPPAKTS